MFLTKKKQRNVVTCNEGGEQEVAEKEMGGRLRRVFHFIPYFDF